MNLYFHITGRRLTLGNGFTAILGQSQWTLRKHDKKHVQKLGQCLQEVAQDRNRQNTGQWACEWQGTQGQAKAQNMGAFQELHKWT